MLFFCEARHVLLNYMIYVKAHEGEMEADLLLTDTTDWSSSFDAIRKTGLFHEVRSYPIAKYKAALPLWDNVMRAKVQKDPRPWFPEVPSGYYDDVWFNLPDYGSKLLWSLLKDEKKAPRIHYIEEGTASYALKMFNATAVAKSHWSSEREYVRSVEDIWLFKPEFWRGNPKYTDCVRKLDSSIVRDPGFLEVLESVFAIAPMTTRKFIFLEECYVRHKHLVNDLDLVLKVADVVGKQNMCIRLHPKTEIDRFTPLGFEVAPRDGSLWELSCLVSDLSDKVFVTIKSSAAFSTLTLSQDEPRTVLMKDISKGWYPNKLSEDFDDYVDCICSVSNKESAHVFVPCSEEELTTIMEGLSEGIAR